MLDPKSNLSPTWMVPVSQFVDQNCLCFEDQEDAKVLEYTLVHNAFKQLVEDLLAAHLAELQISTEEFTVFCEYGLSGSNELHRSLVEQLISVDDFLVFKAMMLKRNSELSREALNPVGQIVVADDAVPAPPQTEELETEAERLVRLEAEQRCVEAELQLAIALSRHLEKRLQLIEALNEVLEMAEGGHYLSMQTRMEAEADRSSSRKAALRQQVWDRLESQDAVLFPRPCHGRIPNCVGSALACQHLLGLPELQNASVVKVHPSIGAAALRTALVVAGKTVLVPPYPGADFLYLELHRDHFPSRSLEWAGDKREYLKWAKPVKLLDIPLVDVVVVASCVVASNGVRLGKGKGYGEVEWGILTALGAADPDTTPVFSICHDLQVVEPAQLNADMMESHDLPVDAFATPSGLVHCNRIASKPSGIRWDLVGPQLEEDIGALRELRSLSEWELQQHKTALTKSSVVSRNGREDEAWQAAVDACARFDAEERRCQQNVTTVSSDPRRRSDQSAWRGKGKGKGKKSGTKMCEEWMHPAQLSAHAESMSAQAEAEAAQQAALAAAQMIQQQQEQFSLPPTLQMQPLLDGGIGASPITQEEDPYAEERRRLDAAEQQERAQNAVAQASAARRQAELNRNPQQPSEEERRARAEHLRQRREALMEKKRRERESELSRFTELNGHSTAARAAERACAGQPALPEDAGKKLADELRGSVEPDGPQANPEEAAIAMRRALTAQLKQTLTQSLH
ncbi:COG0212 [Symbiodinium necroappetens]|uniref:COG0212 protein n=1 Tax=Symbiodinium necroappetens TaxID=1628268 RepID=A0A812TSJ2_9DINO|nr:COG0212 [Symbiodinium necroappetens]